MKKVIYSIIILCLFISVQTLKAQNLDQTLSELADRIVYLNKGTIHKEHTTPIDKRDVS